MTVGTFPFGQPIRHVAQADRSHKQVFVLGVYASAVHALWRDADGRMLVQALGVASEPCIFWRGENAGAIVSRIDLPDGAGSLEPAASRFNGPSGRSIDDHFLGPLGLTRDDAWLCDLVPHSCMNPSQRAALSKYRRVADRYDLPPVNWPSVPAEWTNDERVEAITDELHESRAEIIITLGDLPLKWFAARMGSKRRLLSYGTDSQTYGRFHSIGLAERTITLLPLVHPRHAARMPPPAPSWADRHEIWMRNTAPGLL